VTRGHVKLVVKMRWPLLLLNR